MEKKTNVPKLRFPEFEGEWVEKKLGEVSDDVMYGMNAAAMPYDGKNKYIRITDIDEDTRQFRPNPLTSPDGEINEKYKLEEGDLVLARTGASVGKSYLYDKNDGNLYFAGFLIKFSIVIGNPYFIYCQTLHESYNKWIKLMSMRSGQPGVNAEEYKSFILLFPSLQEQTKIASFLTPVDDKLTQLKKKKSLLEEYKKGVMQKIFFQELRFKDDNGEDFPEWEEKKIGKVCKIYDGTHQTPDYVEDGIPFYSVEHVTANDFTKTKYISRDVFERENSRVKLEKGDILMTRIGDIGTAKYIDWDVEASFYVSLALLKRSKMNNNEFIYHYINSSYFKNELYQRTIHVAFPKKINLGEIGECLIKLPSLPEQTKIANFLSAIDEKINHCSKQIERVEDWKKGLLQQMFV